ncbi:Uncharacterised protein (plasmid) [Legionella adelaidensis]|uniref:Uncharacterized protein n=1 Tax=Legionella adelaidensis TaxID=45056 RepID=A0A0W0R3P2_9GAMM|nr:hypothetical protein [Legionella adelaidensis]KTC65659.1 hypothetical protein Lade_0317 [Legionella adelaidensis]VEH85145.1 Uncharacterised protein [Legionella adelaidensis]
MPKPDNLNTLLSLLDGPINTNPDYFLFLLGTDTVFTPRPTAISGQKTSYDHGETLSYVAQVTTGLLNEGEAAETRVGEVLSYTSPSVDVLNGPTTLGREVGQRIAQAVFLVLCAVAEGKKNIHITGHSRGAVQSILLIHELNRIKHELEYGVKTLFEVLKGSPCAYTKSAIVAPLFKEINESPELRRRLLTRLQGIKVFPFLIDPVPGDPGSYLTWSDSRFFERLPCSNYELLICRDERTYCFTPIIPFGAQAKIIPGHHGTASGNLYNQQRTIVPKGNTATVQKLVIYKLLQFFSQTSEPLGAFKTQNVAVDHEHPQLDALTTSFLCQSSSERTITTLQFYDDVYKNDAAFKEFTKGGYPYLSLASAADGQRLVYFQRPHCVSMSEVSPAMKGEFVNTEHAMLYVHRFMDISEDAKPSVIVSQLVRSLQVIIRKIQNSAEDIDPRLSFLLENREVFKAFSNVLSIFVDTISRKYLRNHLSLSDKQDLLRVVSEPFEVLASADKERITNPDHKRIVAECEDILKNGIKNTTEMHFSQLKEELKETFQQLDLFLRSPEYFENVFTEFLQDLSREKNEHFDSIHAELSALPERTPQTVERAFITVLERVKGVQSGLPADTVQSFHDKIQLISNPLSKYLKAHQLNTEEYLQKLEQLYDMMTGLNSNLPLLSRLVQDHGINISPSALSLFVREIIYLGGRLLKEKGIDLRVKPDSIVEEGFFRLIKNHAIALGAPSPEMESLQTALSEEKERSGKFEQEICQLKKDLLTQKLLAEKELKSQEVLTNKLLPLTIRYYSYLEYQLAKNESDAINAAKIDHKLSLVAQLRDALLNPEQPLPSLRLMEFHNKLMEFNEDIRLHRDSSWIQFMKSCLGYLALVVTGILPGLIYAKVTGRSPLFFTKSCGQEFIEASQNSLDVAQRNQGVSVG